MTNLELARSLYEAFGTGDVAAILAAFDPDIEWREAESNPYQPDGSPWRGGDAIMENLFVKLITDWDGFTVTPKEIHDAGDTVVIEGRYNGTHNATGKRLDAQFCHVARIQNGKITSFQQYTDTAQMREAMGV